MGTVGDGCWGTWEDWMLKTIEICSHLYRIAAGGHQGERVGTSENLGFPRGVQTFILEVGISRLVWAWAILKIQMRPIFFGRFIFISGPTEMGELR